MKEAPNISQTPATARGTGPGPSVALGDVIDALVLPDSGDDTPTSVLTPYPNSIHPQDLQQLCKTPSSVGQSAVRLNPLRRSKSTANPTDPQAERVLQPPSRGDTGTRAAGIVIE